MTVIEVVLLGGALSMDAFAVGLTNGMVEPHMKLRKALLIAAFYGGFQFLMPMAGYYGGSVFSALVEKIAPVLSFILLAFIGGKMIWECVRGEGKGLTPLGGGRPLVEKKTLGLGKLFAQAVATSIDALAVGVSLLAQEIAGSLPFAAVYCAVVIGLVTFFLSTIAVTLGRTAGDKFADKAEIVGGFILVAIGLKLLLEGII